MNITEINPGTNGTWLLYLVSMLPMTAATVWIIVAFQSQYMFKEPNVSFWKRLCWPYYLARYLLERARRSNDRRTMVTPYYGVI